MTARRTPLPPLLAAVAEQAGESGALKLMVEFGGQSIKVPKNPRPWQVLWKKCGRKVAEALAELRGGENVPIPNGAQLKFKKQAILESQGSSNAVAKAHGVTERYVRELRNARARPLPLFDRQSGQD